jgi:hypothetical protein
MINIKPEYRNDPFIAGSQHCNAVIKEIVGKRKSVLCKICNQQVTRRKIYLHFAEHYNELESGVLTEQEVRKLIF